jgi:hypothetical protein
MMPPSSLIQALRSLWLILEQNNSDTPVSRIAIAGGLAVTYWGHPRSTRDIDLAIMTTDYKQLETRLLRSGLQRATKNHLKHLRGVGVYQWRHPIHDAFIEVEVDFLVSNSEFHSSVLARAIECSFAGLETPVRVVSCEDLLLLNAMAGRMIDLADIETLSQMHQVDLDRVYLTNWISKLELGTSTLRALMN